MTTGLSTVFSGTHEHTMDGKGRVIVPATYREGLGEQVVLAPGLDRCVELYPREVYEERVRELRGLSREDGRVRAFQRFFNSRTEQETLDSQGRITVTPRLREYAGLERELAIIGNDRRVEIWDRDNWEDYARRIEPEFASLDSPLDPDLSP